MPPATCADDRYLETSEHIDHEHPTIQQLARELAAGSDDPLTIAERCFVFVRDKIRHSVDFKMNPVTCRASDVLLHRTGYCYAKSHLLAALLRANGIPAGLCYQRLTVGDDGPSYCLHGLNAVFLPEHGWYRIDARGNKPGVDAQFTPPLERLAFAVRPPHEADFPEILAEPLPVIVETLLPNRTWDEVAASLPDKVLNSQAAPNSVRHLPQPVAP
jgi:transglutaminase-like putative cysteine protease